MTYPKEINKHSDAVWSYKGNGPHVENILRMMEESYPGEPVTIEELQNRLYEETNGRELSGVLRQIRNEE